MSCVPRSNEMVWLYINEPVTARHKTLDRPDGLMGMFSVIGQPIYMPEDNEVTVCLAPSERSGS